MKTNAILRLSVLTLLFVFLSNSFKAQGPACMYKVKNLFPCAINVTIEFYDSGLCKTITQTIPASTTWVFNCSPGCGNPLSNVIVKLSSMGGNSGLGMQVDMYDIDDYKYNIAAPCGGADDISMHWAGNETIVGP